MRSQEQHLGGQRTNFVKAIQKYKYFLRMGKSRSISYRFFFERDKIKHQQSDQENYDNSSCTRTEKFTTSTLTMWSKKERKKHRDMSVAKKIAASRYGQKSESRYNFFPRKKREKNIIYLPAWSVEYRHEKHSSGRR